MKIADAFTSTREQQARDRLASEQAETPTYDSRTGERIPHCVGRRHYWIAAGHYALKCLRCPAVKVRDR